MFVMVVIGYSSNLCILLEGFGGSYMLIIGLFFGSGL